MAESYLLSFFFFNDTATTEIYTLSLHDALPISRHVGRERRDDGKAARHPPRLGRAVQVSARRLAPPARDGDRRSHLLDRKSTRLNSSHGYISYAVFCLKKKKQTPNRLTRSSVTP